MAIAAGAMATTAMGGGTWWAAAPVGTAICVGLLVGLALLVSAAVRRRASAGWLALAGTLAILAIPLAAAVQMFAFVLGPLVLVAPAAVLVVGIVALAVPGASPGRPAVASVAVGTAIALAAVAVGMLDGLVWLPLALAPGYDLDAIYAELIRQDEDHGIPLLVGWAALAAAGVVAAGAAALRRRLRPSLAAACAIAPAVAALLVLQWWEFSMGMSVSDALPPYAGGQSDAMPWIGALTAVLAGLVAGLALRGPISTASRRGTAEDDLAAS